MEQIAADYKVFKDKMLRLTGLDLNAYKQTQMERRLRALMSKNGAQSFQQFYHMIEDDGSMLREFMDRMTINVSEMFRNPDQFNLLETKVVPELLKTSSSLRVWSAGCSYGQEPYSLAIILQEVAPRRSHKVTATDIDRCALESAQIGVYTELDVKCIRPDRKKIWLRSAGDKLAVSEQLKSMVEFGKLDLLKDAFPKGMDLILCRNVVIYFTDEAKSQLYKNFFASLKPGGYLFIGGTERIPDHETIGFTNPYPYFYRKPTA